MELSLGGQYKYQYSSTIVSLFIITISLQFGISLTSDVALSIW
jgi:hypothetical protein